MSNKDIELMEREYEQLFITRDQLKLFLEVSGRSCGYVEQVLALVEDRIDAIREEIDGSD